MSPAADPDPLAAFRTGRLGPLVRPPAFAAASDPDRLLGAVAEALNQCERHGLVVDLEHGAVLSTRGYVLPVGDGRLGSRWAVRERLPSGITAEDDDSGEGLVAAEAES